MSKNNKAILSANEKGYDCDNKGNIFSSKNKKLKLNKDSTGYFRFSINTNNEIIKVKAHRFIAFKKFGKKIFEPGTQVRHLDGNSLNNSWNNIEIGTQSENMMDRLSEDRIKSAKNAARFLRKFSDEEIKRIRVDRKNGMTYLEISKKWNGIGKSTLSYIFNKAKY